MKDEIIQEVWDVKDSIAKKYNYSFAALVADLRRIEKQPKWKVIDLSTKKQRLRKTRRAQKAISKD